MKYDLSKLPTEILYIKMADNDEELDEINRNAVNNYIKFFGCEPTSVLSALSWQEKRLQPMIDTLPELNIPGLR